MCRSFSELANPPAEWAIKRLEGHGRARPRVRDGLAHEAEVLLQAIEVGHTNSPFQITLFYRATARQAARGAQSGASWARWLKM